MKERGIFPSTVENAINNYKPILEKKEGTLVYYDIENELTIIQNTINRKIITVSKG